MICHWKRAVQVQKYFPSFGQLHDCLIQCHRCPRLVRHREIVPETKRFQGVPHWRRPVPGFGDQNAWLLILGLAPSAQGGNRTGRIFTGDASAKFLFEALHRVGFAKLPHSLSAQDGQKLTGCYLTAAVKCVPPRNLPSMREMQNCAPYLWNEFRLLNRVSKVLILGRFALAAFLWYVRSAGGETRGVRFQHGKTCKMPGFPECTFCYHPSPQNTNTGRLTMQKMLALLRRIQYD